LIASELIATDIECLKMARLISRQNYQELFNDTWLRIRELELKGLVIKDYRNYFFKALRNNSFEKPQLKIQVEFYESQTPGEQFLYDWINSESKDDDDVFYKNIITLAIKCKNKRDAFKFAEMDRDKWYKYFNHAKQLLKDEYFRTTTVNDFDFDSLV
jgi:hypothetical protein